MKRKYVIYTSLTGGYDALPQYDVTDPEFDYICFSNDYPDGSKQGIWEIKRIPFKTDDNILLSRYAKLLPHKLLQGYDFSLWLDSNLKITGGEFYKILKDRISQADKWYGVKHPSRDCIYDEAEICTRIGRSGFWETRRQIQLLKHDGYPAHYGLFENNIMLRQHNDSSVKEINELWWKLFNTYTHRDQLNLFYIFWKKGFKPSYLLDENLNTRNVEYISYIEHGKKSLKSRMKLKLRSFINRVFIKILH